ncbi:Auxin-responsive protein SAUR41 [Linum grandiflorum]
MLGEKMVSFRKLAKKVKVISRSSSSSCNFYDQYDMSSSSPHLECLLVEETEESEAATPMGYFAVYVGEDKERYVVPTGFLSHPLFKMLMEKAYSDQQRDRLVIPCSVSTFQEIVNAIQCCNGRFDLANLVEELL